jgi:hypothetical protein
MGNILTYLKWRGEQTFLERAFCEVDNLILSELSYWNFDGIVPAVDSGDSITLKKAAELFYEQYTEEEESGDHPQEMLKLMADSKRYQNVLLSNYMEVQDEKSKTEFSALHIILGDGTAYVAFRGTGDYIWGWRENFSMSFRRMGAQKLAAAYLKKTMTDSDMQYRVGGHSKGGNLAVYAAMMCSGEKNDQIKEIYSNDGPGLCPVIIDLEKYRQIQPKLIRIVPEYSIIGSLFAHESPTKIVASSASGLGQHVGISWLVEGDAFCEKSKLSTECQFYNHVFDEWIKSATIEQRRAFTRDFFDALESGGAKRISELGKGELDKIKRILFFLTKSKKRTKIAVRKLVKSYFSAFRMERHPAG